MGKENVNKKVLEEFNKQGVDYCILRNYEDPLFRKNKDLDILISRKDGVKVKRIFRNLGLLKRIFGWGPYLISDRKWDIKIGCLDYDGLYIKSAGQILKNKRKKEYFYVIGSEDKLTHLILKSMSIKPKGKKYRKEISLLINQMGLEKSRKEFYSIFGTTGERVFELIRKKRYSEAIKLRDNLKKDMKLKLPRLKYLFFRLWFPCLKR